jgi:4-amino-4-deoxy-L-arabinose transferase-like glycosyltransferase
MSIQSPPSATLPRTSLARLQQPAALLGLLAVWLLATLGWRPLLLPDEGRYAGVARAMLAHGDALVPTLNGLPFFHKPPLFYWLDMAAMQVVGGNAFAGRFGSAVGAWIMGVSMFFAMRRWHGPRVATIALGVLATTPFFFIGAQYADHDMLVAGLITAALLALTRAVEQPDRVDLRWLVAGWVLCALAVLSKGLIGIVLPALVIGPWLLAQGRWRQMLKLLHPLGPIAFALVAAPWFVMVQQRYPGFFDYFFMEQHFRRFAQSNFNNVHGVWFFIVGLPLFTLPWSAWLPAALRMIWSGRVEAQHSPAVSNRPAALLAFYAWWVFAIVGFFSIPSSKLIGYVMPALAPWCALLTLAILDRAESFSPGRVAKRWPWIMTACAVGCVAIVAVATWMAAQATASRSLHSNRALAVALASQLAPEDKIVMIDEFLYDVPFYARLQRPVLIASNWSDPDLPLHDNWRKEIFDAARFDAALGKELLVPMNDLASIGCGATRVWFIVPIGGNALRVAAVNGATRVFADSQHELWRAPGHACR